MSNVCDGGREMVSIVLLLLSVVGLDLAIVRGSGECEDFSPGAAKLPFP
jgi:hypothetical protein